MKEFSIYRIIGNSLPPRHSDENNINTIKFIVENEKRFDECVRVWILNKLANNVEKLNIIKFLEEHEEKYIDIPFNPKSHFDQFLDPTGLPAEYKKLVKHDTLHKDSLLQEWLVRHKSQHLVGINEARNHALHIGRQTSSWALVLDGGVMFTNSRWFTFVRSIRDSSFARFAVLPMQRIHSWKEARQLCSEEGTYNLKVCPDIYLDPEPQLAFRYDSEDLFDESLRYGHRNKAELISRIGVPGPWNEWKAANWEKCAFHKSPHKGQFIYAGSLVRLPTDGENLEDEGSRYSARFQGVAKKSLEVDLEFYLSNRNASNEFSLNLPRVIADQAKVELEDFADDLLRENDRFVTQKTLHPYSPTIHDYYSVAPHFTAEGIRSDGFLQITGSDDDPSSERFDRKSLSRFANRVYGLALSGQLLGRKDMLLKAVELIQLWIFNQSTRMNPTARYSQIFQNKVGIVNDIGIIEFRHLALLPFAIRILLRHGVLSPDNSNKLKSWFNDLIEDCKSNQIYSLSLERDNNIGTWASVLFCSSSLFVGDFSSAFNMARLASIRLGKQLGPRSIQPYEINRTRPLHYSLFNLSAWTVMSRLASEFSISMSDFQGVKGESLVKAITFCSDERREFADYSSNAEQFDFWIDSLASQFLSGGSNDVLISRNSDLGIPPITFK